MLFQLLEKDECKSNPCQHGGTCQDGFNRYFCRCADGYEGNDCEQDIDECSRLAGTELGCQNGGTCLNTFGSFHCLCPPNYKGVRCTVEFNDCRNSSDHELCGNGMCFNLARTQSNAPRFRCDCYRGFTKSMSGDSSPCDLDIDECKLGIHHCSVNPPVECINTHSWYTCGPCPPGYSGNGFTCVPLDQCLVNNGGCSMSPRVSCFSSSGRVVCGSCPAGFVGDGTTCDPVDGNVCSSNNGGCFPTARCVSNTAISALFRFCVCPPGTTGTGVGPNGCVVSTQSCANNPCRNNALCTISESNQVRCICPPQFSGQFCDKPSNSCASNPCMNGGACVNFGSGDYR